jgi:hypothetical protein
MSPYYFWLLTTLVSHSKATQSKSLTPSFCVVRSDATAALLLAFGLLAALIQTAQVLGAVPGITHTAMVNDPAEAAKDSLSERGSHNFGDMGSWIWETNTFDRQTVRFWKWFQIPSTTKATRARLRITGDNEYTLFLDGRELGRDAEWRHLYEYDITSLLTPGKHVLAVEVYNSSREAGMVLGLRVGLADGNIVEVKSDQTWLIVPDDVRNWEKKVEPAETWHKATIITAFASGPWGKVDYIDLVPPLQPFVIPFWQTGWFQIVLLTVCGVVSLISFRLMTQVMVHQKEKELLQRERGRIARDIHDDLGLRVTQLVLQGEVALRESPAGSATRVQYAKICEEAREALRALDEILWAINPGRDTLGEFATYICGYAQTFLKTTPIQCVLDVESEMSQAAFDLPFRRNLLLAVKEALNNAVKHSHATELLLKIRWQNNRLYLIVEDNGNGFDPVLANPGRNGLTNMAQRMAEAGGTFHLTSQPGQGCRVEFNTPLKPLRPHFSWLHWRRSTKPPVDVSSTKIPD